MNSNRSQMWKAFLLIAALFLLTFAASASKGRVVREVVRGSSLEKNLIGESPDRNVSVYLPPGYDASLDKRFPVVYLLHGIADTNEVWHRPWSDKHPGYATVPELRDKGIAEGRFGEMIVVMPDQKTKWLGSFYVNSSVTGNWEDFTTRELVGFIDGKYRTLNSAKSRGLTGHSMGGYGALTLGMKHPDVFSVVYGLNSAIVDWGGDLTIASPGFERILQATSADEVIKTRDLYTVGVITLCQAFSPNPEKPPFYCDYPFKKVEGKMVPDEIGFARWKEKSPIRMVEKYRDNLNKLRGLKFDSGYEDEFRFIPVNNRALSNALTHNGIEHVFEEYNGDHRNRLWGRTGRLYNEVFPYFWLLLEH